MNNMAKQQICSNCSGRGGYSVWGKFPCDPCGGSGFQVMPGVGMDIFTPCPYCKGARYISKIRWEICNICRGTGRR